MSVVIKPSGMPDCCVGCNASINQGNHADGYVCLIHKGVKQNASEPRWIPKEVYFGDGRPKWCPLRPAGRRKTGGNKG